MQKYEVQGSILGFEGIKSLEIVEVDEFFSTMRDSENENISFTIANPYALREYSFDITPEVNTILNINKDSKISVYNLVIIQEPLENSTVNFLAPIIANHDNNKITQIILDARGHPDFGMTESIKSFRH